MDRFRHYIDGAFEEGAAGFESLDPATGRPWALMPERLMALTAVLMFVAVFYAVRVVLFVTFGPDSPLFSTWFGSISANFVTMTLTVVAAIVTSVLRSHRTAESRYAWLTEGGVAADGVMRARTFADAAADILARASWRADGVAIIVIHVDGVAEIRRRARGGWPTGHRRGGRSGARPSSP